MMDNTLSYSKQKEDESLIDTRPTYLASNKSLWDQAHQQRDKIAAQVDQIIQSLGYKAWVRGSKPGEYPLYILVDSWKPISQTENSQSTERSLLKIIIEVEPYRTYPLKYTVELKRQKEHFEFSYWELSDDEISELARYLINGGFKPKFFKSRVSSILLFLGAIFPPILWLVMPRNKLIEQARPSWFTIPTILGWIGVIGAVLFCIQGLEAQQSYYRRHQSETFFIFAILSFLLVPVALYISNRRSIVFSVPIQSHRTPRKEVLIDSWHVSVPGAGGNNFVDFEKRLINAFSSIAPEIEINKEMHQKLNSKGFEERERYVLTKGQANVHIHIYPFSDDAFVGWDGYLNFAKWQETQPVSTNVKNGQRHQYLSLNSSISAPTEFDLIELNALSELIHRSITNEIRVFLKEKEIEADLDFKIIRGNRDNAFKAPAEDEQPD